MEVSRFTAQIYRANMHGTRSLKPLDEVIKKYADAHKHWLRRHVNIEARQY